MKGRNWLGSGKLHTRELWCNITCFKYVSVTFSNLFEPFMLDFLKQEYTHKLRQTPDGRERKKS